MIHFLYIFLDFTVCWICMVVTNNKNKPVSSRFFSRHIFRMTKLNKPAGIHVLKRQAHKI